MMRQKLLMCLIMIESIQLPAWLKPTEPRRPRGAIHDGCWPPCRTWMGGDREPQPTKQHEIGEVGWHWPMKAWLACHMYPSH